MSMNWHDYLHKVLTYNADTGELRWKERPASMFKNHLRVASWNTRFAGTVAGCNDHQGYLKVSVGGTRMQAHRVAWIMVHGDILPKMDLDHINGDRSDNRIANLRIATRSENLSNSTSMHANTSGIRGVCWNKRKGKWMAQIKVAGLHLNLGLFDTKEEAAEAYRAASLLHHGAFSPFQRSVRK